MKDTNNHYILEPKPIILSVVLCIIAALCYSIMTLLVKLVAQDTTESMTVFFRFTISLLWIGLVLCYKKSQGKKIPLKTKHLNIHIIRATCSFIAMYSLYYALKYVPLADATSLSLTYALFIPILSFIFFRTKTNLKNWLALITGFIGIIFILRPLGSDFNPKVLMALVSGLALAGSLVGVHELAKNEQPYTIMLHYFSITFILSCVFTAFSWKTPTFNTLIILLISGVAGTAYQELITRAMSFAPPKIVAPILYSNIIFSGIFDWLFWRHVPSIYFWLGTIMIALSCIFSIKEGSNPNN